MTKIAFLGLGAMGSRMVAHLIAAGHDVTVWNRGPCPTPDGASRAASPAEAAQKAEFALSMVTDDTAARAVWLGENGALLALPTGALVVEMSTLSPGFVAELAAAAPNDIGVLDAPVAGSRPQAEAGELVFLAGGTPDGIDRFRPLADVMGKALIHAGDVGKGAVLKLMINGMLGVQTAALAEILKFGAAHGIPAETAKDLMAPVPVMSPAANTIAAQIAAAAHDPLFTVDLMEKDLGYLTEDGSLALMAATRGRFAEAADKGQGGRHITAVAVV